MISDVHNPLRSILPVALITPLKIIALLSLVLFGVFNFSAFHWIILGLLVVAVFAISDRVSRLNASHHSKTSNNQRVINTDGGSFSQAEKSKKVVSGHPVVQDGGIYNRKS